MSMRIAFRVDAAKHIGTGHLHRCLTLAKYFRNNGHLCIFFCRDYGQEFYSLIQNEGFIIELIGQSELNDSFLSEKDWLGVSIEQDSLEFVNKLKGKSIDLCILDHYAINKNWEHSVRKHINKLVVIDDLAREHECDILLDQNLFPSYGQRYDHCVPANTIKLLGSRYALLKEEFRTLRNQGIQGQIEGKRILINFGGVGNYIFLKKVISVISQIDKYDYIVITGTIKDCHFEYLKELVASKKNIKIMQVSNNMAELMISVNFSIGACGSTVWERFCLGLNAALVQVADNQAILLDYLAQENLIDNLGDSKILTEDKLYNFLSKLDFTSESYHQRRSKIMQLVDGLGAARVYEKVLELNNV